MTRLAAALDSFTAAYHARPDLIAGQRGWSRTILLQAADTRESIVLRIEDGRIAPARPDSTEAERPELCITADAATLCDILELRLGPNEPYLFGELTVQGSEADLLRLDYITDVLCPR